MSQLDYTKNPLPFPPYVVMLITQHLTIQDVVRLYCTNSFYYKLFTETSLGNTYWREIAIANNLIVVMPTPVSYNNYRRLVITRMSPNMPIGYINIQEVLDEGTKTTLERTTHSEYSDNTNRFKPSPIPTESTTYIVPNKQLPNWNTFRPQPPRIWGLVPLEYYRTCKDQTHDETYKHKIIADNNPDDTADTTMQLHYDGIISPGSPDPVSDKFE